MPWSIKHHVEFGLLETIYYGYVTDDDIKACSMKAISVAEESGISKFLANLSDAKDFKVSNLTLFEQPEKWQGLQSKRRNKLAILVPDSEVIMRAARFYETVGRNRGWNVLIFLQRQEAMDWLVS